MRKGVPGSLAALVLCALLMSLGPVSPLIADGPEPHDGTPSADRGAPHFDGTGTGGEPEALESDSGGTERGREPSSPGVPKDTPGTGPGGASPSGRFAPDPLSPAVDHFVDASLRYAILTIDNCTDIMQELADWKTRRGLRAQVFNLSYIYPREPTGRDDAEKVHMFLRQLKGDHPQLQWVLLVGDYEHFPTRHVKTNGSVIDSSYIEDFVASDVYYAGLDSDWDTNGNMTFGEYGEEDWFADVYVGRLPVDNPAHASICVEDILTYEQSPPAGGWASEAVFVGALLDTPNRMGTMDTLNQTGYFEWWRDNGMEIINNTMPLFPKSMVRDVYYDYNETYYGNYSSSKDILHKDYFVPRVNDGCSVIVTESHGWIEGDGVTNYIGTGSEPPGTPAYINFDEYYYWTDARNATNGGKLPFWYASSCSVGNFTETDDTNFVRLLTNPGGGAIGLVSPVSGTSRGENAPDAALGNQHLMLSFWGYFFNRTGRPGEALYLSKAEYDGFVKEEGLREWRGFFRQNKAAYMLLGDPEVPVWTDEPGDMTVSAGGVHLERHDMVVHVEDAAGVPVEGAQVCLRRSDIYRMKLTGPDGNATFALALDEGTGTSADPEPVEYTVTMRNFLPAHGDFPVTVEPADLALDGDGITFSQEPLRENVTVEVRAEVSNLGDTDAADVRVMFEAAANPDGIVPGSKKASDLQWTTLGTDTLASLPADGTAQTSVQWTPGGGPWSVRAVVDPDDEIAESYEGNNLARVEAVALRPELRFTGGINVSGPEPLLVGATYTVSFAVEANDSAPAGPFQVMLYRLNDTDPNNLLHSMDVPGLARGASVNLSHDWTVGSTGFAQIFQELIAVIDPGGAVTEYDEGDNRLSRTVETDAPPSVNGTVLTLDEDGYLDRALSLWSLVVDPDDLHTSLNLTLAFNSSQGSVKGHDMPGEEKGGNSTGRRVEGEAVHTTGGAGGAGEMGEAGEAEGTREIPPEEISGEGATVLVEADGYLSVRPDENWHGRATFILTADDGHFTGSGIVTVDVLPVNDPPVLEPLGDAQGVVKVSEDTRNLIGVMASDPDGDILTFTDNTTLFDIDPVSGEISFTPENKDVGDHAVRLTVGDGMSSTSSDVTFRVENTNDAPVMDELEDIVVEAGTSVSLGVVAYDPDTGDLLEFSDDTHIFDIDRYTGDIQFLPQAEDAGKHLVTVTVSDGEAQASASFNITITDPGDGKKKAPDDDGAGAGRVALGAAVVIAVCAGVLAELLLMRKGVFGRSREEGEEGEGDEGETKKEEKGRGEKEREAEEREEMEREAEEREEMETKGETKEEKEEAGGRGPKMIESATARDGGGGDGKMREGRAKTVVKRRRTLRRIERPEGPVMAVDLPGGDGDLEEF